MMGDFGMGGGWFGMGSWWILAVVLLVVVGGFLFRRTGDDAGSSGRESARDILDKRYARGEIEREEYEQKKRDLPR